MSQTRGKYSANDSYYYGLYLSSWGLFMPSQQTHPAAGAVPLSPLGGGAVSPLHPFQGWEFPVVTSYPGLMISSQFSLVFLAYSVFTPFIF